MAKETKMTDKTNESVSTIHTDVDPEHPDSLPIRVFGNKASMSILPGRRGG
jgi:hypothetical protein